MRRILYSCFGQTDEEFRDYLDQVIVEGVLYKGKDIDVINKREIEFLEFMIKSFDNAQQFPTESLFINTFPELANEFSGIPILPLDDFRVYIGNVMSKRINRQISKKIMELNKKIELDGMSDELMEQLEEYHKMSGKNRSKSVEIKMDFKTIYEEKLTKNKGLTTGVEDIDKKIGGMNEGSLTTIAGFTSHFKTTYAMNIAYRNTYHSGYNLVYLSLETPKEDMLFNILCRHSYDRKFVDFNFIPHETIRRCELTPEQRDFLYNVVEPDLYSPIIRDGEQFARGKLIILDERDFNSMSFTDIYNVFESIDNQLGGNLDGFFVDYAQLCKFTESGKNMDDNRIINSYVTFFRRMTQKFRAGDKRKMLIGVLLSQINRENWKKAVKKDGKYDLTCLADANELERGSYRVLTTYTTEDLKAIKVAQLQILKNRGGATMWEPVKVYADGESYVFGDEMESFGMTLGGGSSSAMAGNAFDAFDSMGGMGF